MQHSPSYSRRIGNYSYDVTVREVSPPQPIGFGATLTRLANVIDGARVRAHIPEAYAPTVAEAVSLLEQRLDGWVKAQAGRTGSRGTDRPNDEDRVDRPAARGTPGDRLDR